MKRLIASFALASLIATPALAATAKPTATPSAARTVKAQHKAAKKSVRAVKPAASGKSSGR